MRAHVLGERVESDRAAEDEPSVVPSLRDDHVHHREREGRVGSRPDPDHLVGLRGGLRVANVDRNDVSAAPARRGQVTSGIGLAREIGAPEEDALGVLAHILLGIDLEHAGEPEPEGAEPPADHGGIPPLAAPEVREATQQIRAHARAVVVREEAVARPEPNRLAACRLHARRDQVERLIPRRSAPRVVRAPIADQRREEPLRIADDLPRRVAAHAEESPAVGVVLVAANADEPPTLDLDQHAAESRVTVHRAHGANDRARAHVGMAHRSPSGDARRASPPRNRRR